MKRICCFVIWICFIALAWGQDVLDKKIYGIDIGETIVFRNGKVSCPSVFAGAYDYKYQSEYDMNFLIVKKKNSCKSEKYLLLHSDNLLILYKQGKQLPEVFGVYPFSLSEGLVFPNAKSIIVSSELREDYVIYRAENLRSLSVDTPWVEGVKGHGIGETLKFSANASGMYIMSGYVSFDKPYLWKQNSRPKKIRISFSDSDGIVEYELKDTPNPQYVDFNNFHQNEIITVEIMSVYEGLKYEDTCIHAVIFKAP